MADHDFIPARGADALIHLGTYRRVLPVLLERLYENVLDWERLPHVHRGWIAAAHCLDAGARGWRAVLTDVAGRASTVELELDRLRRRWVTRVTAGHGAGRMIRTRARPERGSRVEVVVDFFVPDEPGRDRRRLAEAFARRHRQLYADDVAMMIERQRQLDRRLERSDPAQRVLTLGTRAALALPLELVLGGREFVLAEVDGVLTGWPRQCPHCLAPLGPDALDGRDVVCPWHGDRFDALTGENRGHRLCRLDHRPQIQVDSNGNVTVTAAH